MFVVRPSVGTCFHGDTLEILGPSSNTLGPFRVLPPLHEILSSGLGGIIRTTYTRIDMWFRRGRRMPQPRSGQTNVGRWSR